MVATEQEVRAFVDELLPKDWSWVSCRETGDWLAKTLETPPSDDGSFCRVTRGWAKRRVYSGKHTHTHETWVATIAGTARIFEEGKRVIHLKPGDLLRVPAGTTHRAKHDAGYDGIEIEICLHPVNIAPAAQVARHRPAPRP